MRPIPPPLHAFSFDVGSSVLLFGDFLFLGKDFRVGGSTISTTPPSRGAGRRPAPSKAESTFVFSFFYGLGKLGVPSPFLLFMDSENSEFRLKRSWELSSLSLGFVAAPLSTGPNRGRDPPAKAGKVSGACSLFAMLGLLFVFASSICPTSKAPFRLSPLRTYSLTSYILCGCGHATPSWVLGVPPSRPGQHLVRAYGSRKGGGANKACEGWQKRWSRGIIMLCFARKGNANALEGSPGRSC